MHIVRLTVKSFSLLKKEVSCRERSIPRCTSVKEQLPKLSLHLTVFELEEEAF